MNRLTTAALFLMAAILASAQQYSYTFNAPAGAITCANVNPYQQYYQNLVEKSTPAYPGVLQPYNFHMPDMPNHPLPRPVADGSCAIMGGFVGADQGSTMKIEFGNGAQIGQLRINEGQPNAQVVYFDNGAWTFPSAYPAEGQAIMFELNASITQVCNAECVAATGQLTLTGPWAFHWGVHPAFRWTQVRKDWTNTDVVQVQGLSTVAILDQDRNRELPVVADFRWPSWLRWLFGASEPVEIYF